MQDRKKSMKMLKQGIYNKKKVKKYFTAGHHIVLLLTAATTWQMMVLVKTLCLIRLTGCCNLDFVYIWLCKTPALKKREREKHLYRISLPKMKILSLFTPCFNTIIIYPHGVANQFSVFVICWIFKESSHTYFTLFLMLTKAAHDIKQYNNIVKYN